MRRGSPERPVNSRLYRGTWLIVGLPLLVAAFSVSRPASLPAPTTPATQFDGGSAVSLSRELSLLYPNRSPGSAGSVGAARWVTGKMKLVDPTEVTGTLAGTVKGGTWTFEYPYEIPAQGCTGTVKGSAKVPADQKVIEGKAVAGGACAEQPIELTFTLTKQAK